MSKTNPMNVSELLRVCLGHGRFDTQAHLGFTYTI